MEAELRSWWQKIKQHRVVAIVVIVAAALGVALIVVLILGYWLNWDWTGLGPYTPPTKDNNFQRGKTLWDWLQLLIIPIVLAVGGYVFNLTMRRNEQETTSDNQREAALQAYIDKMSELLLKEGLRQSGPEDEVRKIARVRTLTVLPRLDKVRKRSVLQFLYESGLIDKDKSIIDLSGAILSTAYLRWIHLEGADLRGPSSIWELIFAKLTWKGRTSAEPTSVGPISVGRILVKPTSIGQGYS